MVRPVTKSASDEARKQITLRLVDRFGDAAQRRAFDLLGLRACERFSQCGRMRSVSVMLGAMALTLMPSGPSSWASLRVKAMMPPLAAA